MFLVCFLALLTFVTFAVYQYFRPENRKLYQFIEKYPGPPGWPLFGNVLQFQPAEDILNIAWKHRLRYGPLFKLWIALVMPVQFMLIVADVHFAEFILSSPKTITKSYTYKFLHKWLGTGLLTAGGDKWRQRRKILTPSFHFKILEKFVDVFNAEGDVLIGKLREECEKKSTFNVYPFIKLYTLDVICGATMGTALNAQNEPNSRYVESAREVCSIMIERSFVLRKMLDFTYRFTEDYKKEKNAIKALHEHTDSVIASRRKEKNEEENGRTPESAGGHVGKKRQAFLDLLLERDELTNEDIREEVDTFMFAGHDTTSSGISFTLYCLAQNPGIQMKVYGEIISILGTDKTKPITFNDLQELKYTELVIKESLRLYPPVPAYARYLEEDIEYENTTLPKGLTVLVFPYAIHRDPKIYPNPDKFDPERFTQANCVGRSPFAYIPFSAGPRNCIGQRFAILEMKATIAKVVRNFELSVANPDQKLVLLDELVLVAKNGVNIDFKQR